MWWHTGVYKPVVDGTAGSGKADVWDSTGSFEASPGADVTVPASFAPEPINIPGGGIVGRSWTVMMSDMGILWAEDASPPGATAGWTRQGARNAKAWTVKYTG